MLAISKLYIRKIIYTQLDLISLRLVNLSMISITNAATQQMRSMQKSSIFISLEHGMCAEHKYILSFIKDASVEYQAHDISCDEGVKIDDIHVMIDSRYVNLLNQVELDYKKSIIGSKFCITSNINASKVCRCGISFTGK